MLADAHPPRPPTHCPSCAAPSAPTARFCGSCGASIPQPAPDTRILLLGRDPAADLVLDLPVVSGHHAEIRLGATGLEIRDLQSTNGTWVDGRPAPQWTPIKPTSRVHLGSYRVPPAQLERWRRALVPPPPKKAAPTEEIELTGSITLGRDPACDVVLEHPTVSWHHARIEKQHGRATITDLRSTNGTYVNGLRVKSSAVAPGDDVRVGSVPVRLVAGKLVAERQYRGEIRLDVQSVSRVLDGNPRRVILDDVSLTVFPGELVALMGPSGAGKTTLLEVLTGERAPTSGKVLINAVDLRCARASLSQRIGYVPQEDIMHRDLTVFEVVYHAARLRLPSDLPDSAVRDQVDRLLERMGLANTRESLIGGEHVRGISGGQRKRVNIAIELLTEPPLLFLDEPTSGLDATSSLEVLQVLRALADEGKTVVMTIHQPRVEAFRLLDMVIVLAKGGKLAYFGPTIPGVAEYFSKRSNTLHRPLVNPADFALDALDHETKAPDDWKQEFLRSEEHRAYVTTRATSQEIPTPDASHARRPAPGVASQTRTLVRRGISRKSRDTGALALQVLQPTVVGVLLAATFHDVGWPLTSDAALPDLPAFTPDLQAANKAHAVLFLIAATSFWLGCSNVAREIVADRAVYRRECMAGLSPLAYIVSTFSLQAAIGLVQVVMLVALAWGFVPLQAPVALACTLMFLTATTGVSVGMLVSACARTEVSAISTLPLLLLPQLLLAGYLELYRDMSGALQALSAAMPVRWAFEALLHAEYAATTTPFDVRTCIGFQDDPSIAPAVLSGLVAVALLVSYVRLASTSTASGD